MELLVYPKAMLARMMNNAPRCVDQSVTDRLHSLTHETAAQYQPFQKRLEVQRQDHQRPPGRVGAELRRRKLPARKVPLHDRMHFFALTATLVVPPDQLGSRVGAPIGHQGMDFVRYPRERHRWKGTLARTVQIQQAQRVAQPFTHHQIAEW